MYQEDLFMDYIVKAELENANKMLVCVANYNKQRYKEITELELILKKNKKKYKKDDYQVLRAIYHRAKKIVA